jgi:flagellar protein FlgJ
MEWGDNALAAPTTPGQRMPVVDKSKVDPQILKAAEGMEAMFLDYMMKVMRDTVPKNEMDLESPATKIYQNMLDSESAQRAARAGGVGLADQIVAYLVAQQYNSGRPMVGSGNGTALPGTGGTHAGHQSTGQPGVERRDPELKKD